MGEFSSSAQIFNPQQLDQEQFLALFRQRMQEAGYSDGQADDHDTAYTFSFAENCRWVAVCSDEWRDSSAAPYRDTRSMARIMGVPGMYLSLSDGDTVSVTLYHENGEITDSVLWSNDPDYGASVPSALKKEVWEPFLRSGYTWEQVQRIQDDPDLSASFKLIRFAGMIGFYAECGQDQECSTYSLYFKKKEPKTPALGSLLAKECKAVLQPLGFQKVKGRQPYFIRAVPGGEIIHVLSYYADKHTITTHGEKVFNIVGGVATVYRREFDFSKSPTTQNWMRDNRWISANYQQLSPDHEDPGDTVCSDYRFICKPEAAAMTNEIRRAMELTTHILVPLMDQITDLEACIRYRHLIGMSMHTYYADPAENFGNHAANDYYNEGLLYFTVNPDFFRTAYPDPQGEFEEKCTAVFEKIQKDPALLEQVNAELARRKIRNTETLHSFGISFPT